MGKPVFDPSDAAHLSRKSARDVAAITSAAFRVATAPWWQRWYWQIRYHFLWLFDA